MKTKPIALVILDGYGYKKEIDYNAIAQAKKPTLDTLFETYPHTLLEASGPSVGLLSGYNGNSEVGHFTIGAGRPVKQPGTIVHEAIKDGSFFKNSLLCTTLQQLPATKKLHIIGLLSDGGVHSDIDQLWAYLAVARNAGIENIVVHPILDGRDVAPQSATYYLNKLQEYVNQHGGIIGSLQGRFYAMDRDNNWERTTQSYHMLTQAKQVIFHNWEQALDSYYGQGITDEFIPPTQLTHEGILHDSDGIICINFRPDRIRQLTTCFIDTTDSLCGNKRPELTFFITPIDYGIKTETTVLYQIKPLHNTLKEILSKKGKSIFSIAETEKYAHITYFFSGGNENAWPHEDRVLIPSLHTKNYVNHPEMSAQKITNTVLESLQHNQHDFYLINYANADMVGHSGDFQSTIKAIECLDKQIEKLFDSIIKTYDGTLYITADHGNAEQKWDYVTKQMHTAHTTNKVPFIMIKRGLEHSNILLPLHTLADIAPFVLDQMGLPIPSEMNRENNQ